MFLVYLHDFVICVVGKENVVKVLLKYGANTNTENQNKDTPLHLAIQKGKEEVKKCYSEIFASFASIISSFTKNSTILVILSKILSKCLKNEVFWQ